MKKIYLFFVLVFSIISSVAFAADPSVQASNLNVTNRTHNSLTVTWTGGNGNATLIVCKQFASTTSYPLDGYGNAYATNTVFGSGSNLGNANYAIYDGNGTSVTITGLSSNVSYTIYAY